MLMNTCSLVVDSRTGSTVQAQGRQTVALARSAQLRRLGFQEAMLGVRLGGMQDGCTQTIQRSLRWLLLGVALLGCDEGPLPIQYETEHLRIGTNSFMCQGDLNELEDHIAFLEDDLGLEMNRVIDVYVWDALSWLARDNECTGDSFGCYWHDDLTIYSSKDVLKHELGHAVLDNPGLEPFFDEGIAEGYAQLPAHYGNSTPSANVDLTEIDRHTATHFVRWLRSRWGGHLLGDLVRHGNFETIYGLSLAEVEAMYLAEASSIYPPIRDCYGPEFTPTESQVGWSTVVQTDCASADTHKGYLALSATRTLVIPTDGRYSLATDALAVSMYRCEDGPGTIGDQLESADVPSIFQSTLYRIQRQFDGLETHTVELRRGRYRVSVATDGYEPGFATVRVWPAVGPGPVDG